MQSLVIAPGISVNCESGELHGIAAIDLWTISGSNLVSTGRLLCRIAKD